MKDIKKYLEENNIEYYILGGTLLGAVRHKGFIPWDDDIDIGIPREQYEKFLSKISDYLPEYLRLDTYKNNQNHHYYFSRIVDLRYSLKRTGSLNERNENVWVDIFPLDGMPNNYFIRKIHMFRLLAARAMYHIATFDKVNLKRPNRPLSERMIIKFVMITGFGRNSDMYKWLNKIDKLLKKYPYSKSKYVVNFMGQYKFKEMFLKSHYGKGTMYKFEDSELMGPDDYDFILTQMYGDYMKPPKDQDKNAHAAYLNEENK
jgi:lipopolysaccharide cholinephosphotransferase